MSARLQASLPHQAPVPALWWLPWQLYRWLVIAPALALSTLLIGTLIILLCFIGLARYTNQLASFWARLNARITLMQVQVEGAELLQPGQSYILVANHLSLVDIYVLYGFSGLDIRWVMKQELRRVPVLGLACDLMGHIYVNRASPDAALESIKSARERVTNGVCVVFFPEGTRSRTRELRPFKKGAFRMANDLGVPIMPVSIHDTNKVLPSDTLDWRPGRVKLRFHEPIPTGDLDAAEVSQLAVKTREVIMAALAGTGSNAEPVISNVN